jgi:CheY-like chemotaxis protein
MTERILVVDDERLIRWSLRKNLNKAGYRVLEAGDGIQALQVLEEEGADLLLLDVRMPGKDGLTVLEEVARTGAGPSTTSSSPSARMKC